MRDLRLTNADALTNSPATPPPLHARPCQLVQRATCNAPRALTMTGKQKNMRDEQIRIVPQILHDSLALIVVVAVVVVWVVVVALVL